MSIRLAAVVAAALSLGAGSASAAVTLQGAGGLFCQLNSCSGVQHVGDAPITIDTISFNRNLLGGLGNKLVHITFWSADGKTQIGDLGNYALNVLGGDVLTLRGTSFNFDGAGDLMFKFDLVQTGPAGGGFGGGGGGFGGAAAGGSGPGSAGSSFSGSGFSGQGANGPDFSTPGFSGRGDGDFSPFTESHGGASSFSDGGAIDDLVTPSLVVVPEPSTWALMLLGFGGLGAALRRRTAPAALG